jgi:hypothetical protein
VFGIHGARTKKVTYLSRSSGSGRHAHAISGIVLLINILIVLVFVWLFPIVRLREPAGPFTVRSLQRLTRQPFPCGFALL